MQSIAEHARRISKLPTLHTELVTLMALLRTALISKTVLGLEQGAASARTRRNVSRTGRGVGASVRFDRALGQWSASALFSLLCTPHLSQDPAYASRKCDKGNRKRRLEATDTNGNSIIALQDGAWDQNNWGVGRGRRSVQRWSKRI